MLLTCTSHGSAYSSCQLDLEFIGMARGRRVGSAARSVSRICSHDSAVHLGEDLIVQRGDGLLLQIQLLHSSSPPFTEDGPAPPCGNVGHDQIASDQSRGGTCRMVKRTGPLADFSRHEAKSARHGRGMRSVMEAIESGIESVDTPHLGSAAQHRLVLPGRRPLERYTTDPPPWRPKSHRRSYGKKARSLEGRCPGKIMAPKST